MMLSQEHIDAIVYLVRTTVTLDSDVAAAVAEVRRGSSIGVSEAINRLIRAGMVGPVSAPVFVQESHDLGPGIDVSNVADALETLAGPASP